ncbi:extracellular solute-binding protein [Pseudogemmobacter faecipullorum]|uniref:Extracellular solute-binding protein n=1 Tax=Pseudogemmobacter faecipullorum TaxID=2755041 RepID=A0ABS8CI56_9RHOB|nr:extracellular solute-binding protein [Pseudogemmobacter faecipullorum]MCB5409077.1 extracellular solute-binding protein [Pseudogemmobacter faecipullorum]
MAVKGILTATLCAAALFAGGAQAETLRLLTWGGYAPEEVIDLFEAEYPDIDVEVTLSNNEEMISKLRATGGAGFDLAQPSHDRIFSAQQEFGIYKPLDLSQIETGKMQANLLEAVKANTSIDGNVYAVPHQWGTTGLVVDKTAAPDVKDWADLCKEEYKGRTSMRLRRTILLGMGYSLGYDPFALYADVPAYTAMLEKVAEKMIECKANLKTFWAGGDELSAMMLSGEVVASESWDSTAFKLYAENNNLVYVPPATGALTWIDTFVIPAKGEADDAAYKWINFVLRPEIVTIMSDSTGAIAAVEGGIDLLPEEKKAAVKLAFDDAAIANMKFFANIPAGLEDIEGKVLERIKAAQ